MCAKQVKNRNNKRKTGQKPLKQSVPARQLQERMNQTKSKRKKNRPQHPAPIKASSVILASEPALETSTSKPSIETNEIGQTASIATDKVILAQTITDKLESVAKVAGVDPSAEQVQNAPEKAELVQTTPERVTQIQTQVEQEISAPKKPAHRKVFSAFWWLFLAIILGLLCGVALWWYFTNQPSDVAVIAGDEVSESTAEPSDTESDAEPNAEPEKSPETLPAEETPTEPEKPAEPQTPPEPQPQSPSTPLAARPNNTADPDVVPGHKVIALTFDDGPSGATTPRLLDILKSKGVKATFFVLGTMARRSPDIMRREASEGHEVASHTLYHNQLTNLTWDQVHAEAVEMDQIFREILGTVPPFTRPPYGSYNATVSSALGQPLILWSIDPRDWADRNASIVCSRVTSAAFDGAIILVHDIHATTVDAVPCIVDNLYAQGYQFLTVSELAAYRNVPLVNGVAYGRF